MLLDRLDAWKQRYGAPDVKPLIGLLEQAARIRSKNAADLTRLHETLLFFRAYPHSPAVARLADAILADFAQRVTPGPAYEEPEISGIAGTSFSAVFSYAAASRLAARHPREIEVDWERYDNPGLLGHALVRAIPALADDWPIEAHVPFDEWIRAAKRRGQSDLAWLLDNVRDAAAYDALQLPLAWMLGDSRATRTHTRLPAKPLFCHAEPLLRRRDTDLAAELVAPPLTLELLPRDRARKILDVILDTSAVRYRELYGFSHPDVDHVYRVAAGRGIEIYFFGVPPEWRLPLRAYHAGMFFKNGVPAGYVETLTFFERCEVGFNLYYTFREGETAYIYARLLQLFRHTLGATVFSVDPYQIGHENDEAIDSGAFWFYRKLGFRSVDPAIARLTAREERRLAAAPGYRTSARTLRKLAAACVLYESPGVQPGEWDNFQIRNLGLAAARRGVRSVVKTIQTAKQAPEETTYLRALQSQPRLRASLLRRGQTNLSRRAKGTDQSVPKRSEAQCSGQICLSPSPRAHPS